MTRDGVIEKTPKDGVDVSNSEETENIEMNCELRLFMIGLSILCIWFALLILCIAINIGFYIFGIPSPKSNIGEVINQTREYLVVELPDEELVEVDVLKWPENGIYPETKFCSFWPNFLLKLDKGIDLTDNFYIEGDSIKIYTIDEEFYGVGRYCKDETRKVKFGYWKCNEITTNVVYYFTDGYTTISFGVIYTVLAVAILILLCIVAISCIVVPVWAAIGLCSVFICNDKRICREWCQGMKEAHDSTPPV